ncbi:putative methyltransferase-domain-containing protein [Scheffersomyces amazonensis]|uniref:putative methyltransferase-domain-containing protein n=1 Tax=Scheffersomyces amazonensis TaxID=1078765 RepID=UPI00315DB67F
MDFDPLSLFTPNSDKINDNSVEYYDSTESSQKYIPLNIDHTEDEHEDDDPPLHILDLPSLRLQPPKEVLVTLLKLLAPEEVRNFNSNAQVSTNIHLSPQDIFIKKGLDINTVEQALSWFQIYGTRFNSDKKLSSVPDLSYSLKQDSGYNAYLTRIISSDLNWINDDNDRQFIYKETSLRISENCGRTAQPEIIRRIEINNLNQYDYDFISLKEPSLTSDNLGLKTWGSSLILANRLINQQKNKHYLLDNVLELGSGTGLVGMACSILGYTTWLTDLQEIVPNLQDNVELNKINAHVDELNWCDPISFTEKYGQDITFNTIVVSDPIYSPQHPYWLVNMIEKFSALDKSKSRVLIQVPLRPKYEQEREVLWNLMKNKFHEIESEIEDGYDDFGEMKFIFKLYIRN